MKITHTTLTIVAIALFSSAAIGQITSNGTGGGNWSSPSTWLGGLPNGSQVVTIKATDSVYFDAAVTITDSIINNSGKVGVKDSSKVIFGSGGVYVHAANAGSLIKAVWNAGSTCLITGVTTGAPSNGNQNFYNLTWNCPGHSGGLNLGMTNNTIGGTVRIINSNSSAIRFTAANAQPASGKKIITINGDVIVDSSLAYLTSTGSGSPSDTFSVVVKGSIISKGIIQLANGSGGMVNWFVAGNVIASAGTFTTNSTATLPDSLIFNGTSPQLFVRGGSVTSSNIRFAIRKGAIVDFDTSNVGGSANSTFTLAAGGTIISGHAKGLKGNLNNGAATILDSAANYEYDGTVPQADTLLPAVVNNLTIMNANGVTLKNPTKINGILALKAGVLDNTIPFTLGPSATIVYQGGSLKVPVTSVGRQDVNGIPQSFYVEQNFPNPFNPTTTIVFGIAKSAFVSAKIFNILGQETAVIMNEYKKAGEYSVEFNATNLPSGVYLYRIQADNAVETKRMMLVK